MDVRRRNLGWNIYRRIMHLGIKDIDPLSREDFGRRLDEDSDPDSFLSLLLSPAIQAAAKITNDELRAWGMIDEDGIHGGVDET